MEKITISIKKQQLQYLDQLSQKYEESRSKVIRKCIEKARNTSQQQKYRGKIDSLESQLKWCEEANTQLRKEVDRLEQQLKIGYTQKVVDFESLDFNSLNPLAKTFFKAFVLTAGLNHTKTENA